MLRLAPRSHVYLVALALLGMAIGCADLFTEPPAASDVLDGPLDGLTSDELAAFVRGDGEFARRFSPATGLGPIFNNVSCASCHGGDGRGRLVHALQRIGDAGNDMLRAAGGPQIQNRAIPGAQAEQAPSGVAVSLRLPPPVFGVGLIETIPVATILANADPNDDDGDGISGRPNWVDAAIYVAAAEPGAGTRQLGRFGRKAQVSNLMEQVTEAYHQDIGITSDLIPEENVNPLAAVSTLVSDHAVDPEITRATIDAVVFYIRTLAPPAPGASTPSRDAGQTLFSQIGCASCHTPVMQTGPSPVAALANKPVQLYSDLLLHDMGDELADGRNDREATGREWRTTPLWGLRLIRQFLDGEVLLMHDGRARNVAEAIELHGGEASAARAAFRGLDAASRRALIDFVESR